MPLICFFTTTRKKYERNWLYFPLRKCARYIWCHFCCLYFYWQQLRANQLATSQSARGNFDSYCKNVFEGLPANRGKGFFTEFFADENLDLKSGFLSEGWISKVFSTASQCIEVVSIWVANFGEKITLYMYQCLAHQILNAYKTRHIWSRLFFLCDPMLECLHLSCT